MQAIDDASRGPLGAIGVLSTWIGGPLTALGSAITLLLIAFGPFVQQLVEYPTHEIPQAQTGKGDGASILQSSNFTLLDDSTKLASVVNAGLNFNPDFLQLRATCPTAQCSWDNFKSIGWCSKCQDTTETAVVEDCDLGEKMRLGDYQSFCRVTLPYETPSTLFKNSSTYAALEYISDNKSHYRINYTTEAIWRMGAVNPFTLDFEPFETLGIPNPIVVLGYTALKLDYNGSGQPRLGLGAAGYCALTFCEREYEAQVVSSVSNIRIRDIKYGRLFRLNTTEPDSPISTVARQPTCWQPEDEKVDLTSPDEGFTWLDLDRHAFCPVDSYARELIPHLLINNSREHVVHWDRTDGVPDEVEDSKARLDRVAAALTTYGLSASNTTHLGTVMLSETYLNVRWWWIIYPSVLQLASAVLLLSTIWYSHRIGAPLWKSSLLAIYYHQIEDLGLKGDTSVERLSGMDKAARETKLRFL